MEPKFRLRQKHRYLFFTLLKFPSYGELSPSTFPGKLIGGLCALCGIFILTLPIPIVVNRYDATCLCFLLLLLLVRSFIQTSESSSHTSNRIFLFKLLNSLKKTLLRSFASYYKNRLWRNEVKDLCFSIRQNGIFAFILCTFFILCLHRFLGWTSTERSPKKNALHRHSQQWLSSRHPKSSFCASKSKSKSLRTDLVNLIRFISQCRCLVETLQNIICVTFSFSGCL